jgi:hypothetical protein
MNMSLFAETIGGVGIEVISSLIIWTVRCLEIWELFVYNPYYHPPAPREFLQAYAGKYSLRERQHRHGVRWSHYVG